MTFGGCGSAPEEMEGGQDEVVEAAPSLQSLPAEDIYAGIFFGVGPARALLPEVYGDEARPRGLLDDKDEMRRKLRDTASKLEERGDTEGLALVKRAMAQLESADPSSADLTVPKNVVALYVQQIRKQSPDFFQRFDARIRSGDPVSVDAALQDAAQQTYAASKVLVLDSGGTSAQAEQAITMAAAVVAAAAVALVAVIWSGVVLVEGLWVVATPANLQAQGTATQGSLLHDELVARVAKTF
ncbi:hypothetical protein ACN28I_26550 [Archangium gephyra]|uniref:hypothetical protein n=1 Tax=Archangium gephyra TaxID=48 RepID=UPI003B7F9F72